MDVSTHPTRSRRQAEDPASPATPATLLDPIRVSVQGFEYRVWLPDDPRRVHLVAKNKTCRCGAKNCAAIQAVYDYLKDGGARAPDRPVCPVCGGPTVEDPAWLDTINGQKGFGWRCENGGLRHWMQAKTARIQRQFAARPWLFEPVYDENGTCVYAGVLRDELLTFELCEEISRRVRAETGYDPTA